MQHARAAGYQYPQRRLTTIAEKVAAIKEELALNADLSVKAAIQEANAAMGFEESGTLPEQVAKLTFELGINLTPKNSTPNSFAAGAAVDADRARNEDRVAADTVKAFEQGTTAELKESRSTSDLLEVITWDEFKLAFGRRFDASDDGEAAWSVLPVRYLCDMMGQQVQHVHGSWNPRIPPCLQSRSHDR